MKVRLIRNITRWFDSTISLKAGLVVIACLDMPWPRLLLGERTESLEHPDFDTSGQDYEHLGTTKVFTKWKLEFVLTIYCVFYLLYVIKKS